MLLAVGIGLPGSELYLVVKPSLVCNRRAFIYYIRDEEKQRRLTENVSNSREVCRFAPVEGVGSCCNNWPKGRATK